MNTDTDMDTDMDCRTGIAGHGWQDMDGRTWIAGHGLQDMDTLQVSR